MGLRYRNIRKYLTHEYDLEHFSQKQRRRAVRKEIQNERAAKMEGEAKEGSDLNGSGGLCQSEEGIF